MSTESRIRELEREIARLTARVPLRQPHIGSPATLIQVRGANEIYNNGSGFTLRGLLSGSTTSTIPAACWNAGTQQPQQIESGSTYPNGLGWGFTDAGVPVFLAVTANPGTGAVSDSLVTLASGGYIWSRISVSLPITASSDRALVYLPWVTAVG